MPYTPEEIAKYFPRTWNGNFAITYGIADDGTVVPTTAVAGSSLVTAAYSNPTATADPGIVVIPDYSDAEGWIDVRRFARMSLTVACTGTYGGETLNFSGTIKVEYRNAIDEPTEGTLVAAVSISGSRHEIIDPKDPADILGIGYVRMVTAGTGKCVVFPVFK